MDNHKGYIDPLLSNVALDYSSTVRQGLVAPRLLPRVEVDAPSGFYTEFSKEDLFRIVDTSMARNKGQAADVTHDGEPKKYNASPHGLKETIDNARNAKAQGPFSRSAQRVVEGLVAKIERAQEKRVAALVQQIPGATTALSGTGSAVGNVWANGGGNPTSAVSAAINKVFMQPNICIMSRRVYNALKIHPDIINALPSTVVRRATTESLAALFDVDEVVIADGKGYDGKKTKTGDGVISSIWGDSVVFARVDTTDSLNEPCVGKTLAVEYPEADNSGYVVRVMEVGDHGVTGGTTYRVACDLAELIMAPDLIHTITNVLG